MWNSNPFFEFWPYNKTTSQKLVEGSKVKVTDAVGNIISDGVIVGIKDDDLYEVEITKIVTVRRSDIR